VIHECAEWNVCLCVWSKLMATTFKELIFECANTANGKVLSAFVSLNFGHYDVWNVSSSLHMCITNTWSSKWEKWSIRTICTTEYSVSHMSQTQIFHPQSFLLFCCKINVRWQRLRFIYCASLQRVAEAGFMLHPAMCL